MHSSQVASGWPQGENMHPKLAVINREVVSLACEGARLSFHTEWGRNQQRTEASSGIVRAPREREATPDRPAPRLRLHRRRIADGEVVKEGFGGPLARWVSRRALGQVGGPRGQGAGVRIRRAQDRRISSGPRCSPVAATSAFPRRPCRSR